MILVVNQIHISQENRTTEQYLVWRQMQKSSIKWYQIEYNIYKIVYYMQMRFILRRQDLFHIENNLKPIEE